MYNGQYILNLWHPVVTVEGLLEFVDDKVSAQTRDKRKD
jgi:hypothetical protein